MGSIKTRIILLSSVLLTLSIGLCLFVALRFLKSAHDQSIFQIFEQTDSVVQTLFEATRRQMKNEASLIAEVPILSLVVEQKDLKTIADTAETYRKQLQIDFVDVFNDDGLPIARVSNDTLHKPTKEIPPQYARMVKEALHGQKFATILSLGEQIAIIGASPLGLSTDPNGVLVVGTFLDDKFANRLKHLTGADISLSFPDKKIISSSLNGKDREALAEILSQFTAAPNEARRIDEHVLRVAPLKDSQNEIVGGLAIYLSLEEMSRTSDNILKTVSIVGLVIILMSLGLSTLMGQALTRKLIAVIEATKRIASGDFQFKLPGEGKDEVGDLARSVNNMSEKIVGLLVHEKEKAEYEKELETANSVQMTFFSGALSETPPFSVSAFYTPASQIGGDWWGHYTLREGLELILIGDATGHGVPAALVTAMAYSTSDIYARIFAKEPGGIPKPSRVLQELNRMLYDSLHGKLCMSFFAAIFDASKQTVTYSNGGHCFPYLVPKDPNDDRLNKNYNHPIPCIALNYKEKSGASILGMDPNAQFTDDTTSLKKGDRVFFYTDGLTEARSPEGKMWGTRHFLKSLAQHQEKNLKDLCNSVVDDLNHFYQQKTFEDDVTLVGVEFV